VGLAGVLEAHLSSINYATAVDALREVEAAVLPEHREHVDTLRAYIQQSESQTALRELMQADTTARRDYEAALRGLAAVVSEGRADSAKHAAVAAPLIKAHADKLAGQTAKANAVVTFFQSPASTTFLNMVLVIIVLIAAIFGVDVTNVSDLTGIPGGPK
jgi:hypothetical protein